MTFRYPKIIPLKLLGAAATAAVLVGSPHLHAGNTTQPSEAEISEAADSFVGWAREQARMLDQKLEKVAEAASDVSADVTDEVRTEWRDLRNAIDRQRDALADQIDELETVAKSEWSGAKEATQQGLSALGDKIEELHLKVTEPRSSEQSSLEAEPTFEEKTEKAGLSDNAKQSLRDRGRIQAGLETGLPAKVTR